MATLRIASLVPSLTELLVELGLRECLVARTGFCIHPAAALRDVPKVGGTKDVNLDTLRRLAPTHVLVNVDENRLDTVNAIRAWSEAPQLVVTHPRDPDDNLALVAQMVERFGAHAGVIDRAAALTQALQRELALTRADARPARRVLYLIWRDPWMTVARDTYIARMLARVGWRTLPDVPGGDAGAARYPVVHGDEPWLASVEQVLLSSEPYRFDARHFGAARALCPGAQVRLVDGELLSWYGARAVAGLRYLREIAGVPGR
ncbi:MAG: ABC transporter substrate-binding protein [Burkholderiales bacterium]|nr:ABC transporter substrate-binding protein [Burkholderiales bacterium]MDE2298078.1 ABC transporter substrate-binding protein [Burkholderiales bacterium]MDE2626398.1 ABC transporter substrate-binding protein [Burkholderiales bacterium]